MSRRRFPRHGCSFFLFLLTLPLTVAGAWAAVPPADKLAEQAAPTGLSSLPAEAQWNISAALGRDQPAYHAQREGEGWRLDNPKHGLRADFTAEGVEVRRVRPVSGCDSPGWVVGRGIEAPSPGTPEAKAEPHRVPARCAHRVVLQWATRAGARLYPG